MAATKIKEYPKAEFGQWGTKVSVENAYARAMSLKFPMSAEESDMFWTEMKEVMSYEEKTVAGVGWVKLPVVKEARKEQATKSSSFGIPSFDEAKKGCWICGSFAHIGDGCGVLTSKENLAQLRAQSSVYQWWHRNLQRGYPFDDEPGVWMTGSVSIDRFYKAYLKSGFATVSLNIQDFEVEFSMLIPS